MPLRQFEIYVPLQDFWWKGVDFELAAGLWIKRFRQKPNLQKLDTELSTDEHREAFFHAAHWLSFHWEEGTKPCAAETANLVLLALWLVKPTKSYIGFRFEIGQGKAEGERSLSRLHSRFFWVPNAAQDEFDDSDLQSASLYYPVLRDISRAERRLNDALILTLMGCWSFHWQSALICYAAASEALLTYSTASGITRRLAACYACLVETEKVSRDAAYKEFCSLYSVRSDIMHGRSHNVSPSNRLPLLAQFRDVLRKVWRKVISSPELIQVLEDSDDQREAYFSRLMAIYSPSPRV